jgi:competence ComEA-like helix-hairpin-helix protein
MAKLFTAGQRRGIVLLILIIFAVIIFRVGVRKEFFFAGKPPVDSAAIRYADRLQAIIDSAGKVSRKKVPRKIHVQEYNFAKFDPNTVDSSTLIGFGLSAKVVQNLLNYRHKGGEFKTISDVNKLYTVTDRIYRKMVPYIDIKKTVNVPDSVVVDFDPIVYININSAIQTELLLLNGVGEILSERIIKYRDLLGGFYNITQLKEVYGLKNQTINNIKESIIIDKSLISTIDINKADFKTLASHPYISGHKAKSILKFRNIKNRIDTLPQLVDYKILSTDEYNRLKYYLVVENDANTEN